MPELHKLVAASLSGLDAGKYGDGSGLWLDKRNRASGKWLFLHKSGGRRREMGLGPFPDVTLKQARDQARKWREVIRNGLDPITERNRERRKAQRQMHLLRDVAQDAFEARMAELKGVDLSRFARPVLLAII